MFNLSFLNSGILFLSSAVIIPLLIYLFARKKPLRVIFSSIKFIRESQKKQRKKINLKNILLLIIRMLIILLVVLAISRPTLKSSFLNKSSLHPRTAIAVIIDNSYSMDYLVDTRTDLEIAKEMVMELNKLLSQEDLTVLLTCDSGWNAIYSQLNYGRIEEDLLRSISITSVKMEISDILELAVKKLQESHLPNQEIYFFTDMQAAQLPEKSDIPVFFIPTSQLEDKANISCQNSIISKDLVNQGNLLTISFELVNHSKNIQEDIIYELFLNGRTRAEKVTTLAAGQRKLLTFPMESEEPGWHSGYVSVRNERLTHDNKNFFSYNYNPSPRVAVIIDDSDMPLPLQTLLELYCADVDDIHSFEQNSIDPETLEEFDNIIIYGIQTISPRLQFTLNKLKIDEKKILYLFSRHLNDEIKSFFKKEFAINLENSIYHTEVEKISSVNPFHPVTAILEKDIAVSGFWSIPRQNSSLLEVSEKPLAFEKDNLLIWLFDIGDLNNPFLLDSSFPVFGYNSLYYTSLELTDLNQITVGRKINSSGKIIKLPGGERIETGLQKYTATKPGVYLVNEQPVAVNIDYLESNFITFQKKNTESYKFLDQNWQKDILSSRYGFEIWKYLLILVLLLFIWEMLLVKHEEKS